MKKVLFATTLLVAAASAASADVRLSGYGRFGLDYNNSNGTAKNGISSTNLTTRLRLQFDMSTETDGGVAFGARFRGQAEQRDGAPGTGIFNGGRFYASYGGFKLQVGNIIGAIEGMSGLYLETRTAGIGIDGASFYSVVTNVNNEFFNWDAYSSGGAGVRNGVEVYYSANGFSGQVSYTSSNSGVAGVASTDATAANIAYSFGDWTVAVAGVASDAKWADKVVVSVAGNLGQFGIRAAYADNQGIGKWGLYGNMDVGSAGNILVFVTDEQAVSAADVAAGRGDNRDAVAGSNKNEGTSWGMHFSWDLGGGVSLEAGGRRASNGNNTVQAGAYFGF